MTPEQAKVNEELLEQYSRERDLTASDRSRIRILACVLVEMDKLQTFINEHAPTYQVRGKSGDTYSRARPEYQQLQEARNRVGVLLDRLDSGQTASDDAAQFLAP